MISKLFHCENTMHRNLVQIEISIYTCNHMIPDTLKEINFELYVAFRKYIY